MKIYKKNNYEYWYDRSTRCWWAAMFENGCQIGESFNCYTKEDIEDWIDSEIEYNLRNNK